MPFPRVTCDGALRMAAHLPDAGCAQICAAATTAAIAATAVGAGRGVGAAAGGCSS